MVSISYLQNGVRTLPRKVQKQIPVPKVNSNTSAYNRLKSIESDLVPSEVIPAFWRYKEGRLTNNSAKRIETPSELPAGTTVGICTYQRPLSLRRFLDSLALQTRLPNQLIIVDASPDSATEETLKDYPLLGSLAGEVLYCRVAGSLRGLTRQRNIVLCLAALDTVYFFDDDIVLEPMCLAEMETVFRSHGNVVGVGAYIQNEDASPGWRWKLLKWLRAVPSLTPGQYTRSGMVIPLRLLLPKDSPVPVDRLPGGCMGWRTELARGLGFNEHLDGYAQAEDVEFSRRASLLGQLVVCSAARANHLPERAGRPNQMKMGRMALFNRYLIHKTTLENRTWHDCFRFTYAQFLSNSFQICSFLKQGRVRDGLAYFEGLLIGAYDILAFTLRSRFN